MGAFAMAGNTPVVVQPMVVGAMVDLLGLTERQAGIVASVELAGLTLGILGLMRAMISVPRSTLALFANGATNYLPEASAYAMDNYSARVTEFSAGCLEGVIKETSAIMHRMQ